MGSIGQPEWIAGYCIKKETLSDCVERWEYRFQKEYGHIYICRPWPGVHLWMNDVYMHSIPTECLEEYHFIKLNYCAEGRSEVLLEDERYVYLEKGILSIDSNAPKENFLFPGGRYAGLELILDMKVLEKQPVQAFLDCGIDPKKMREKLEDMQGSYLACVSGGMEETGRMRYGKAKAGRCGRRGVPLFYPAVVIFAETRQCGFGGAEILLNQRAAEDCGERGGKDQRRFKILLYGGNAGRRTGDQSFFAEKVFREGLRNVNFRLHQEKENGTRLQAAYAALKEPSGELECGGGFRQFRGSAADGHLKGGGAGVHLCDDLQRALRDGAGFHLSGDPFPEVDAADCCILHLHGAALVLCDLSYRTADILSTYRIAAADG